ncbi:MAG: hypothetical protein CBB97_02015 [Candidatus Endolissoclinum sp. TMED37]|nr:MAG: hypothetical protein CBB97_02015 [Candidatus Endolissoclinum sp. TMED37]
MKNEKIFIYGRHAVFAALKNIKRKIDKIYILKNNKELNLLAEALLLNRKKNINLKYVDYSFLDNIFKKKVKHQGIVAQSYKINQPNYKLIFQNKKYESGIILDSITDANNAGAIYRSAKAFDLGFIINTKKNSILENSALLNTACGAFESIDTFITNNISNSIKTFITKGWWVIGLDHEANLDIQDIISKLKRTEKCIFVFGSEGKGIRRLVKKNCNFLAKIPNVANTESINVSNAAAIVFYELFKKVNLKN